MILSHHQIEDIGAAVIQDFNKFFYCGSAALGDKYVRATPIDQFACDYLGLYQPEKGIYRDDCR